jgi:hypothetical protein
MSDYLLKEDGDRVLQEDDFILRTGTEIILSLPTIASELQIFEPTIVPGDVAVTVSTIASGSSAFAPEEVEISVAAQELELPFIGQSTVIDSLISFWELEESSGQRNDSHGTNHLNSDNAAIGSVTGKVGNALDCEFDNNSRLTIASNTSLQTGDIDFTICGWANLEDQPSAMPVAAKGYHSQEWELLVGGLGEGLSFGFLVWDGSSLDWITEQTSPAPPPISFSTWYFVVVWHDSVANTINIQVNNGTPTSKAHSTGVVASSGAFYLGGDNQGLSWDGPIDQVGFWKRVLTTDERTYLYNSGNGRSYASFSSGGGTVFAPTVSHVAELPTIASGSVVYEPTVTVPAQVIELPCIGSLGLFTSLQAFWELEADGTDSYGANHLTNINSVTFATGKVGNAGDFERSSTQKFTLTDNTAVSVVLGEELTIAAWVWLESLSTTQHLVTKGASGSANEYILQSTNTRFRFLTFDTPGFIGTGSAVADTLGVPATGTWYFVVAWHDETADTDNIQINNGTIDSGASVGIGDGTGGFAVGGFTTGTDTWDGLIDQVGLWKRVLTTDERTWLYNSGSGRSYADFTTLVESGSIVYAPTIDQDLTQTLVLPTIASGSTVTEPSTALTVQLPTIGVGSAVTVPTLAHVVVLVTISSGSTVTEPSTAASVQLPTISSGSAVAVPTVAYDVSLSTISSGSNVFQPSTAASVQLPTIASGSAVNVPTVVPGAVTIELPVIASSASVFEPSLGAGAATVELPTISSGSVANQPSTAHVLQLPTISSGSSVATLTLAYAISLATIAIGSAVFQPSTAASIQLPTITSGSTVSVPTLTVGAVTIELPTIASGSVVNNPIVSQGAVAIELPTISSGSAVFQPSTASSVQLPTISVGSAATVPTLAYVVALATIASGSVVSVPTIIESGALALSTISSGSVVYQPTLTVGATTIVLSTISSGSSVFQPSTAFTVQLPTIAIGSAVFTPTVTGSIALSTIISGSVVYAPIVAPDAVVVVLPTISSGSSVFTPSIGFIIDLPTIDATSNAFQPSTIAEVTLPTIVSSAMLYTPLLRGDWLTNIIIGTVEYAGIGRTLQITGITRSVTATAVGRTVTFNG